MVRKVGKNIALTAVSALLVTFGSTAWGWGWEEENDEIVELPPMQVTVAAVDSRGIPGFLLFNIGVPSDLIGGIVGGGLIAGSGSNGDDGSAACAHFGSPDGKFDAGEKATFMSAAVGCSAAGGVAWSTTARTPVTSSLIIAMATGTCGGVLGAIVDSACSD